MLLLLLLIALCVKSLTPTEDDALCASLRTFFEVFIICLGTPMLQGSMLG